MLFIALTLAIALAAFLAFRWFERYRYTDAWRKGELRAAALSFLMWFGGLFGHRVPPPPQPKIEYATGANTDPAGPSNTPAEGKGPPTSSPTADFR